MAPFKSAIVLEYSRVRRRITGIAVLVPSEIRLGEPVLVKTWLAWTSVRGCVSNTPLFCR